MNASSSTSKSPDDQDQDDQDAEPKAEAGAAAPGEATRETGAGEPGSDDPDDAVGQTPAPSQAPAPVDDDDRDERPGEEPAETARRGPSSVATGAAAVVSAGLGLASLTGTWLSDLMTSRQELIGQINTGQTAQPSEQVAAIYGSPWHTTALFNGFFALAALIVGGGALLLATVAKGDEESPAWVRAVALGGVVLGVVGLVIAALMWFDVFTELPAVPEA